MASPAAVALAAALATAFAVVPPAAAAPPGVDPVLEKRVMRLAEELRCLVCQNQTIADSNADLAVDLRNQVREQLRQGRSEDDVRRYMVERYGDFVLYRPPLKGATLLLWFGPLALVGAGMTGLVLYLRKRRTMAGDDDGAEGVDDGGYDDIAPPAPPPRG